MNIDRTPFVGQGDDGATEAVGGEDTGASAQVPGEGAAPSRLIVRGWPEGERQHRTGRVEVRGEERVDVEAWTPEDAEHPGRVTVEREGDAVVVTVDGDAAVRAPRPINLQVERIPGTLEATAIAGTVRVEAVGVAVSLRDVGPVHIEHVGANLRVVGVAGNMRAEHTGAHIDASEVKGDVHIESVGAHVKLRDVEGAVDLGNVGGHAKIQGIRGALKAGRVGGHLKLADVDGPIEARVGGHARLSIDGAQPVNVRAGGHVRCEIAEDVGVDLVLAAGGGVKVQAADAAYAGAGNRHGWSGSVGGGGPKVVLKAGGAVKVNAGAAVTDVSSRPEREPWGSGFDDIESAVASAADGAVRVAKGLEEVAEDIAGRVADALEGLEERLSGLDLGDSDLDRIRQRVEHVGERFTERLERRLGRAATRVAKAGLRAEGWRGQRSGRGWWAEGHSRWHHPESELDERAAAAVAPGATGDEVMTILRMLEEKRISAEEAERLLAALRRA